MYIQKFKRLHRNIAYSLKYFFGPFVSHNQKRHFNDEIRTFVFLESLTCRIYPCYTLSVGEWSDKCEPIHRTNCGQGVFKRNAVCRRSDGNQVDLDYCLEYVTGINQILDKVIIATDIANTAFTNKLFSVHSREQITAGQKGAPYTQESDI